MAAPGGTFNRDAITQPPNCPPWLATGVGEKLQYGLGLMLDCLNEGLRQGMLAHVPGFGDPGALAFIGDDRQIQRGYSEAAAAYATRLQQAYDTWATAGDAWSVLRNLLGFVSPSAPIWRTVTSAGIWDSMNDPAAPVTGTPTWRLYASPSNFDWDGNVSNWWRFFTVVYPTGLWTQGTTWGAPGLTWGGYSGSWGLSASPQQIAGLRKIVGTWKAANTWCQWMIFAFDSTTFVPTSPSTPDGTWGPWSTTVNGARVSTRLSTASYASGVT